VDAVGFAVECARGFAHQDIAQRADHPRQIVRNGRGSMAHWRPPVPVTPL
jgi:hypothetical protein